MSMNIDCQFDKDLGNSSSPILIFSSELETKNVSWAYHQLGCSKSHIERKQFEIGKAFQRINPYWCLESNGEHAQFDEPGKRIGDWFMLESRRRGIRESTKIIGQKVFWIFLPVSSANATTNRTRSFTWIVGRLFAPSPTTGSAASSGCSEIQALLKNS